MEMKRTGKNSLPLGKNIMWLELDPFKFETSLNISKHTFGVVMFW